MILGPVQMDEHILEAGRMQVPYPRTAEFSEYFSKINKQLQNLFCTSQPVLTVTGSGTAAMQMAVENLVGPENFAVHFATGTFGKRWGEILSQKKRNFLTKDIEFGCNVSVQAIKQVIEENPCIDTIFVTYNETSSTALCDIQEISNYVRTTDKLLVVDAVSSLGAEPLMMDKWGVDVVLTGSQKFIGIAPGLAFISFSEKSIKRINSLSCDNYYFDAKKYLHEWERGQVPYTASLGVLNQLKVQLDIFDDRGIETIRSEYRERTDYLRNNIKNLGFSPVASHMGNCTSAFYVPDDIDAYKLSVLLRRKYGISIGAPYPGGNSIRIGNFGAIYEKEIDYCTSSIIKCLEELRMNNV